MERVKAPQTVVLSEWATGSAFFLFPKVSKEGKTLRANKVPPYERQPEESLQMYMQVHGSGALEGSHEKALCMT